MKIWLIDTGPLVAYLDASDPAHEQVASCLDGFAGRLATTGAVVTEAMHLAAPHRDGPFLLAEFISTAGVRVHDFAQPPQLRDAAALMQKYRDTPMDYADATLVLLAERLGAYDVATLDRRGFSTYRASRRKPFQLVLGY